jgi:hypothetical protein
MVCLLSLQAQHVYTWNIGPHTDPNWDEYCRNSFSYTMKCKAAVEHEHCSDTSLYPQGVSWSEFTVNLQDVQIHPDTGTISPWYCECFDDGMILNHPIRLDVSTMEAFLAGFSWCSFDHTHQKYFELQFLAYKKTQHFYKYYDLVVQHCRGFNIFVPPLHTLVQMDGFGMW